MAITTKTRTNGTTHHRNGHARPSRLAGVLAPLDTVSHGATIPAKPVEKNEAKPAAGRTAQGTFAPGNKCATGNPTARRMVALRSALLGNLTADKMTALGEKLYTVALAGDMAAAKLLLSYAVGKPPEAVDADRLDLDEWAIANAAPTLAKYLAALFDTVHPGPAAAVLLSAQVEGLAAKREQGRAAKAGASPSPLSAKVAAERLARVGK